MMSNDVTGGGPMEANFQYLHSPFKICCCKKKKNLLSLVVAVPTTENTPHSANYPRVIVGREAT